MSVLGKAVTGSLAAEDIEWWKLPANVVEVTVDGDELLAVCPVTGQPDRYDWDITFENVPCEPEGKSLKMYLTSWRDVGISCADLAAAIANDLTQPSGVVTVVLHQSTRGGMRLGATAVGSQMLGPEFADE